MSKASSVIIRWSLAVLFVWFGSQQLMHPSAWSAFLPEWTGYFPVPGEMLVRLNGWMEVVLGASMAAGLYVRIAAAVLGAHLFIIAVSVGGAIGARDYALSAVTLALALSTPDEWTLDR
ncbi:MAG: DoxX family membrane protein, partial [Patescibacteria group bacterium]